MAQASKTLLNNSDENGHPYLVLGLRENAFNFLPMKSNEFELFVVRWMNSEPLFQTEVSQKEKNKYHMLTHIHET